MDLDARSDDGLADPQVVDALTAHREDPGPRTRARALAVLVTARVFAAVTARASAVHRDERTGLRAESTAEMALVTVQGTTGRGVPVFLDVPSLTGFDEGARPVRLTVPEACTAARQDGAVALLVDPSGAAFVVTGDELTELAAGRVPVPGSTLSARTTSVRLTTPVDPDPHLVRQLRRALRGIDARLLDGPDGPVVGVAQDLTPAELAALAARLAPQLDRPVDLTAVAEDGPGYPLRRRLFR